MAIEGLLVYNVAYDNSKYQEEIVAFLAAFKKHRMKLTPVSNIKVFNVVESNPSRFAYAVFWDQDIHVARYLEEGARIPIFNSEHTISTCADKALIQIALRNYNVPMPETKILPYAFNQNLLNYFEDVKQLLNDFSYPFLLKRRYETIKKKIYLIADENKFKEALIEIGKEPLFVQQYIMPQSRRVIRASVVGGHIIAAVERLRDTDKYGNIYEYNKQIRINRMLKKVAVAASNAVNADFSIVDIIIDKKKNYYVYDVKTNAGVLAIERETGLYISWYIARLIKKIFRYRREQLNG